ncbi:MAG: DUF4249 domain-containing protein [Bacteroidales bacterium]
MTTRVISLFVILVFAGCKDEVFLQNTNNEPKLVVDGFITNESEPCIIELSITNEINEIKKIPYTGCIITLYENTGISEILIEIAPGIYSASQDGINGTIGKSYKITIKTPDEKEYFTEFQEMKEPVEIDSVYAELSSVDLKEYPFILPGYQFYTTSMEATDKESYFLWKMIETYQYTADYQPVDIINSTSTVADYLKLYRCWKTESVKYFYTGTTASLTTPKIIHQPLHFVGTETNRLQERYSLLLKQYSIDSKTYDFWKCLNEQVTSENILFSTQPYNVVGNVKNLNNSNEIVLGNFTVASVTHKRIFVDRPRVTHYYDTDCSVNYSIDVLRRLPYPVYVVITSGDRMAAVMEGCINCTSKGGEPNKPEFWID